MLLGLLSGWPLCPLWLVPGLSLLLKEPKFGSVVIDVPWLLVLLGKQVVYVTRALGPFGFYGLFLFSGVRKSYTRAQNAKRGQFMRRQQSAALSFSKFQYPGGIPSLLGDIYAKLLPSTLCT